LAGGAPRAPTCLSRDLISRGSGGGGGGGGDRLAGAVRGGRDARESRGLGRASTAIEVCEETDSVSSSLGVPARAR